jgi:hypothetical protein
MTPEEIEELTMRVYRRRLEDSCPGDADRALKTHGPALMQRHANIWKPLITATLIELGLHEKVRGPKQAGFEKVLNTHEPKPQKSKGQAPDDEDEVEDIDA